MSIYTNPIMQQVEKYCSNGFFPICKMGNDRYAIFTPFIDKKGFFENHIRRTDFFKSIDNIDTWNNGMHTDSDYQPTEIVGFYHLPTPKFEIGDKVRIRENIKDSYYDDQNPIINFARKSGIVKSHGAGGCQVEIINNKESILFNVFCQNNDLEPYLEEKQKPQTIQIGDEEYEITKEFINSLKKLKKV